MSVKSTAVVNEWNVEARHLPEVALVHAKKIHGVDTTIWVSVARLQTIMSDSLKIDFEFKSESTGKKVRYQCSEVLEDDLRNVDTEDLVIRMTEKFFDCPVKLLRILAELS